MSKRSPRLGRHNGTGSFSGCLRQFLTPELFKQARALLAGRRCRWELHPLLFVLISMTWCLGDSQPERFETARAFYVCLRHKRRRPGKTIAGFHKALARLPCSVLRFFAAGVRTALLAHKGLLETDGWKVFGCDGTALLCPRTQELEKRLATAGGRGAKKKANKSPPEKPKTSPAEATKQKVGPPPQLGLSALVHLRSGVPWAWRLGAGAINERDHLQSLLPTLPLGAVVVADCGYQGYEMAVALTAKVAFLIRVSSLATLYPVDAAAPPGQQWRDGEVWLWPLEAQRNELPPVLLRLIRVSSPDRKVDVWLLTNVREEDRLSAETAGKFYKMRWGNEGFFRTYKRTLNKVKLSSRTVRLVHREAEGSLLAVQLLLAQGAQARVLYKNKGAASARELVLQVRREIAERLKGRKRGRGGYQKRLSQAVVKRRRRSTPKEKRRWPARAEHKPPKPPKIRTLDDRQKALLAKLLQQC